jgi:hypothetical protein
VYTMCGLVFKKSFPDSESYVLSTDKLFDFSPSFCALKYSMTHLENKIIKIKIKIKKIRNKKEITQILPKTFIFTI